MFVRARERLKCVCVRDRDRERARQRERERESEVKHQTTTSPLWPTIELIAAANVRLRATLNGYAYMQAYTHLTRSLFALRPPSLTPQSIFFLYHPPPSAPPLLLYFSRCLLLTFAHAPANFDHASTKRSLFIRNTKLTR